MSPELQLIYSSDNHGRYTWPITFEDYRVQSTKSNDLQYKSEFYFFLLNVNSQKQPLRYSIKKDVLKNLATFTGKHLLQSLFFNKVAGLNFVKRETLAEFSKNIFIQNTSGQLLLELTVNCGGKPTAVLVISLVPKSIFILWKRE